MDLWHGSSQRIERPLLSRCRENNDYGRAFYCTPHEQLAMEWACPDDVDGIANRYKFDKDNLVVLDLESQEHCVLEWLALLLDNRGVRASTPLARRGVDCILESYLLDISQYDVIRGYRADDSYFSFARAFVTNQITLEQLSRVMRLGDLGIQYALRTEKALDSLEFVGVRVVKANVHHAARVARDEAARESLWRETGYSDVSGIYIRDIIEGKVSKNDVRI